MANSNGQKDGERVSHGSSGADGGLARRSYLKAAGLVAAGAFVASGTASAAQADYPYALVIDGRDAKEPTDYSFEVADTVEPVGWVENNGDSVSGTTVEGTVDGNLNAYWFETQVTEFSVSGPAAVEFGSDTGALLPEPSNTIVITSPSVVEYEFTATGEIRKRIDDSDVSAEKGNDKVTQNDDGTWTATGSTGNGYGDSYDVFGEVTEFTPVTGDFDVRWNGQSVTVADLTGQEVEPTSKRLAITSPSEVAYEFTATDTVTKRLDDGDMSAEEANDVVTQNDDGTWTVSGYTGNGYGDSYDVAGEVTAFSPMDGDYTIEWDGQTVTAYELTGTEPDQGTEEPSGGTGTGANLGGGDGYANTVAPSEADYTANSLSSLQSAFQSASAGDVVYLTGDVSTSSTLRLPRGVTLASDRGIDGAPGAVIATNQEMALLEAEGDNRITGVRFDGPMTGYEAWDGYPAGWGVDCLGSGIEIDNCELYGFAYTAVRARSDEHVHHCDIHDNPQGGLGYGVVVNGGHPLIEYCTFDANRHSVAGSGSGGYTVRYNWFGPDTVDHVIDMHSPGGEELIIHHNTVEATHHMQDSGATEAVYIRDRPSVGARIEDNWFYHPNEPSPGGDPGEAVRTPFGSWSDANVDLSNNAYGSSDPGSGIGAPR